MTWLKKNDILTKAICLVIAAVLWFYVVDANEKTHDYKVKDIEPDFIGAQELMVSKNLKVVGEYSVDVEVSGSRRDILSLESSDIKVEVDLSKVTSAGTYELPYTVELPSFAYTLKSKDPDKITVKLDEENVNVVPVRLATEELAESGYVVDKANVVVVPKELKLYGLAEEIEKVSYVSVNVGQSNAKSEVSGRFPYTFYDVDGKALKLTSVATDYDMVDVTIPVLKTKELPLSLEITGNENFKKYVEYDFEPKKILVAGNESFIEQMTSVAAGAVRISDITSGMKKKFTLTMPEGILNLSGQLEAEAEIRFDGLSKKKIKTTLIEIINTNTLPTGYKITPVTTSLDVDILGTDEQLAKVNGNNVRAICDLKSTVLSRGTHPVNVSIVVDGVSDTAVSGADNYIIYVKVS